MVPHIPHCSVLRCERWCMRATLLAAQRALIAFMHLCTVGGVSVNVPNVPVGVSVNVPTVSCSID